MRYAMTPENIFNYSEPKDFLSDLLTSKTQRNPGYSLRAWSRQLGFKNPSLLSAVLRGERRLSPELTSKIEKNLALSEGERRYFKLLILKSKTKRELERTLLQTLASEMKPPSQVFQMALEQFRLISDWFHFAILELLELHDFHSNVAFLSKRLIGDLPVVVLREAVGRLINQGLVKVTPNGWRKAKGKPKVGDQVPSEAIKQHHHQMLGLGALALNEQPLEQRDFRSSSIAIHQDDLNKAKKWIQELHRKLQGLAVSKTADEVFVFNSQFFSLTRKP
jgi:uncharacterized protein (TIGR02147 family)